MKRKPKPLGTEFKDCMGAITGVLQWLDLCEGKDRMKFKKWYRELGCAAACVRRAVEACIKFQTPASTAPDEQADGALPVNGIYNCTIEEAVSARRNTQVSKM